MAREQQKVLIIKVGYSETLDPEISNFTSFGDVLRSTVLLHLYKNDHVTWLVDEKAYPILKHNPYIDRILIYNLTSVLQLESEHFDTIINLEKVPGLCALADRITAWRRYGFRFDMKKGEAEAYVGTENALSLCQDQNRKKNHNQYWQEHLFEMVDSKWQEEEYVFGFEPEGEEKYDIGFNFEVGKKWPSKAWPLSYWQELESLTKKAGYSLSWQQGLDNMEAYFEWIHACRLLITNDSFGLHLALAMKKKVIVFFGPTNSVETYLYDRGVGLQATSKCPHLPCYLPKCTYEENHCLEEIQPKETFRVVEDVLELNPTLLKTETLPVS